MNLRGFFAAAGLIVSLSRARLANNSPVLPVLGAFESLARRSRGTATSTS